MNGKAPLRGAFFIGQWINEWSQLNTNVWFIIWKLTFFSKYGNYIFFEIWSIFFHISEKIYIFFGFKNIPYDSFWAACFLSFFSFIQRNVLMLINNEFYTRLGPRGTRQKMLIAILCRNVCFYISKKIISIFRKKYISNISGKICRNWLKRNIEMYFYRNIEKIFFSKYKKNISVHNEPIWLF